MMLKDILIEILKKSTSWDDIRDGIIQYEITLKNQGINKIISGDLFELFAKYYFMVDPRVKDLYTEVWLYNEIPLRVKNKLNIGSVEHGVDLILRDYENTYFAVQCKFRYDESKKLSWSKDKIGNLFGFIPQADHYIVFTNASEIDSVSKTRSDHFTFINIHDLLEIKESTLNSILQLLKTNKVFSSSKFEPKPHQIKAIQESTEYFQNKDKGQLILPCGAGKTLTALWIKEALNSENTLVLVPSLALLRQIKNQWSEQKNQFYKYICVCSDRDIDSKEQDSIVLHTYEIDSRVTTDPEKIKNFISKSGNKVIFSTYQSVEKIVDAIKQTQFEFDLIVSDEAHRTAGLKISAFTLVHQNNLLPAKKRLYMTATPRVASTNLKNKLGDDLDYLYDMSNPEIYGDEIVRMSFKEAINSDILVDYKIIGIGVSDKQLKRYIENRRFVSSNESIDEVANNYALDFIMDRYKANHAITFHSRIKFASQFTNRHKLLFKDTQCFHISGKQSTSVRSIILNNFKKSLKAIVSNARCLTEGVDVPAIDLVYFSDPKNSKIDIVQASGRALRKDHSRDKKIGYIVVPIFHSNKDNVEDSISKSIFNNLIQVIRSLADHDERLQDEINQIAYGKGKRKLKRIEVEVDLTDQHVITLENFEEKLKTSLFDQIIERTSNKWDLMYFQLCDWLKENEKFPTKDDNPQLYGWIGYQRNLRKGNALSLGHIRKLDSIGFIWDSHKASWEEKFNELREYRKIDEYEPSPKVNRNLYQWLQIQKAAFNEDRLSKDRVEKLKSLNFKGSANDKNWEENYLLLIEFRKNNPSRWPAQRSTEPIEHRLAVWFLKIRSDYRKGELSAERIEKLKEINFPFYPQDRRWNKTFNELKTWLEKYGEFPKYQADSKKEKSLNNWCKYQRDKYLSNELTDEQFQMLDSVDFNLFIKGKQKQWNDYFKELKQYVEQNKSFPTQRTTNSTEVNQLAQWCNNQRANFRKGSLEEYQILKLKSINFPFKVSIYRNQKWNQFYQQLKDFRKHNPNRWPNYWIESEKQLAAWCMTMKSWYKGTKKNAGPFPKDRYEKLKAIGFQFDSVENRRSKNWDNRCEEILTVLKNEPDKFQSTDLKGRTTPHYRWIINQRRKLKENKLVKTQIEKLNQIESLLSSLGRKRESRQRSPIKSWDSQFEELRHFLLIEGKELKIQDEGGKRSNLYQWLAIQKMKYRKSQLNEEQIIKLESIGIDLNSSTITKSSKWNSKFEQLKSVLQNTPDDFKSTDENGKTTPLYRWLSKQKKKYREHKLTDKQIEKLKAIGINLDTK